MWFLFFFTLYSQLPALFIDQVGVIDQENIHTHTKISSVKVNKITVRYEPGTLAISISYFIDFYTLCFAGRQVNKLIATQQHSCHDVKHNLLLSRKRNLESVYLKVI